MRRAATQLAHRASARFAPATTSTYAGWVPTDGTGSPGQRAGCGLANAGGGPAAWLGALQPSHRLGSTPGGPTFASSSFATAAPTKPTGEAATTTTGTTTPPPDVETVNALFIEVREGGEEKKERGERGRGENHPAHALFLFCAHTHTPTHPPQPPHKPTPTQQAREELEYAAEDAGTTYAEESYTAAVEAVEAVGRAYAAFIASLPEEARGAAQRGMGMKFEQLRAELEAVEPGH